ncbi:MAG: DUF2269 family protein [Chloroflexi bacterium]|nr:MAG: DUF2269 family protein [Chloroflexota bacterium]
MSRPDHKGRRQGRRARGVGRGRERPEDNARVRHRAAGLMAFFYTLLKFIHVAAAITAVGSNITYGVWNALAAREAAHMSFMLKGIKFLDDRIANPSYGVLFLTGLLLIFIGHWSITSLWIIVAIVLFVAVAVIGFAVFSPLLKDQIRLADAGDTASPEFTRLSSRSRMLGPILGIIVIGILVMMVFKPAL